MTAGHDYPISAQVVLNTTEPSAVEQVREYFRNAGFDAGPFFGTSFSISGSMGQFASHFSVAPQRLPYGGRPRNDHGVSIEYNLPMENLPEAVKQKISAIIFTRPPDFGPVGGY